MSVAYTAMGNAHDSASLRLLARKVSKSKWMPAAELGHDAIQADAVSGGCIRTSSNRLSVWRCESQDREHLREIAMALALSPKQDRLDKVDLVLVSQEELEEAGISHEPTEGDTCLPAFRNRHLNLINLDLEKLVRIANLIASSVREKNWIVRFTKTEIVRSVKDAIQRSQVDLDCLHDDLRRKLMETG